MQKTGIYLGNNNGHYLCYGFAYNVTNSDKYVVLQEMFGQHTTRLLTDTELCNYYHKFGEAIFDNGLGFLEGATAYLQGEGIDGCEVVLHVDSDGDVIFEY